MTFQKIAFFMATLVLFQTGHFEKAQANVLEVDALIKSPLATDTHGNGCGCSCCRQSSIQKDKGNQV